MVGNLGKNVKKIAEVGLSRINASVSSSISDEERRIYTNLVVDITERSQLFDVWYRYFEGYRSLLLEKGQGREGDSEQEPTSLYEARQLELTESALTSLLMVPPALASFLQAYRLVKPCLNRVPKQKEAGMSTKLQAV